MAMLLHTCERCREGFTGSPYRVLSEGDDGIVLLDMRVCQDCYRHAWQLGLDAEKLDGAQPALNSPAMLLRYGSNRIH